MGTGTKPRKRTGRVSISPDAALKAADRDYERALREAGISRDDLKVVRELAEQASSMTPPHPVSPTRIYL